MKNYPKGIFKATVTNLRKKNDRYFLFLELYDEKTTRIFIDIHDSICETAGISDISFTLKEKIVLFFPETVKVSNLNGYWKLQNEAQILSDVLLKAL